MADEDKNPKTLYRRCDEWFHGERLSDKAARKLKHPDDPDVKLLEKKNQYIQRALGYEGEVCKDRSWYLYESRSRYKRTENPEYKRYKNYSLAGTVTGAGMLVTGLASGNLPLAYSGATLALGSVGYLSGHSLRHWQSDERFEKVPWPEENVQKKLKEAKAKDEGLYQSLKHWITDHIFQKEPWCEDRWKEQDKEPKDEGLYIRRTYKTREWTLSEGGGPFQLEWRALNEPKFSQHSNFLGIGIGSLLLGGLIAGGGALSGLAPLLYAAAAPPLYALGHYVGFLFGKKKAEPEYQKVSGPEEKVQEKD